MTSKAQEAREEKQDEVLPPPAYDASQSYTDTKSSVVHSDGDNDRADIGPSNSTSHSNSARAYASPLPIASLQQPPTNLTSRASRRDIQASLSSLYADIVAHPTPATADVFRTVCETCRRAGLKLEQVSRDVQGKQPIYWMVVHRKAMPGALEIYLEQRDALLQPSERMLRHAIEATLVHDDMEAYHLIQSQRRQRLSTVQWHEDPLDTIALIRTEPPNLGFLATLTVNDFGVRLQTQRTASLRFVCRHREWVLHLGQIPALPGLAGIQTPVSGVSEPGVHLVMQTGERMPIEAQIRLRHPEARLESSFLSLGRDQALRKPPGQRPGQGQGQEPVAWCGPVSFSKHRDWKALTFGEGAFFGRDGTLTLQLHVRAVEESQGECVVQ